MFSDSGLSINILCAGDKFPLQRCSFKNIEGNLLPIQFIAHPFWAGWIVFVIF